jgi:hypothetical protein
LKRLILFAKPGIGHSKTIRRHVTLLGKFIHLTEDLHCLISLA